MEYALYISDYKNLRYWSKKYSRLYFGVEFCEKLLPSCYDLDRALDFAQKKGLGFTFVTPYVTNKYIKKVKHLLRFIKRKNIPSVEVVFNDIGVLNILKDDFPKFIRVLGRLKTIDCEPLRISPYKLVFNKLKTRKYLLCLTPENTQFFKSESISRLEINAPSLAESFSLSGVKFPVSLYLPYGYVSTTRYCPLSITAEGCKRIAVIDNCHFSCINKTLILRNKSVCKTLLLRGNTYFYETGLKESNIKDVSRIVYQPRLPC